MHLSHRRQWRLVDSTLARHWWHLRHARADSFTGPARSRGREHRAQGGAYRAFVASTCSVVYRSGPGSRESMEAVDTPAATVASVARPKPTLSPADAPAPKLGASTAPKPTTNDVKRSQETTCSGGTAAAGRCGGRGRRRGRYGRQRPTCPNGTTRNRAQGRYKSRSTTRVARRPRIRRGGHSAHEYHDVGTSRGRRNPFLKRLPE